MEAQPQRPGTLTFLITDLVGSTEQLERLGDEGAVSITTMTIARLAEAASEHGGEVVKNLGDGIMVVFTSALDAVACAVSMQHAMRSDAPQQTLLEQLPVRIGIHAGEPIRLEGDYLGMPVNVAVKMCHVASDGQILVSDVVRGLVGSRGGFAFTDVGERVLGGLRSPVRLWEVTWKSTEGTSDADRPRVADSPRQRPATPADRAPDTVVILFADIVDSMPQTERLGDAGFRERARELDGLLRTHVREHRGATVDGKLVGDGILAIFPSARSAIACALQCGALSASVELELHLGIHAGDVIRDGNNIYGGAVNIASRISAATKAGEILVSDTVRGIARTSGGVSFEDRGEYILKGIDEPMRLFNVRA
jgi:class 3 adenylate cyclase